jgi:hypothetical protein
MKLFKLLDLITWWNKCLESKSFCTLPEANAIDFETLYDEIM